MPRTDHHYPGFRVSASPDEFERANNDGWFWVDEKTGYYVCAIDQNPVEITARRFMEQETVSFYHDAAAETSGAGAVATGARVVIETDPETGETRFKQMMGEQVMAEASFDLSATPEEQEKANLQPSGGVANDAATFMAIFGDLDEIVAVPVSLDMGGGNTFECMIEQLSAKEAGQIANKAWRGPGGKVVQEADKIADAGAILNVQRCVVRLHEVNGKEVTEPIFSMKQVETMYAKAKTRTFFESLYTEVMKVNSGAGIPLNLRTSQPTD